MRISPGALLVLIAVSIPFIVQSRTVAAFIGLDMSVWQMIALGTVTISAIILWAVWPEKWLPGRPKLEEG